MAQYSLTVQHCTLKHHSYIAISDTVRRRIKSINISRLSMYKCVALDNGWDIETEKSINISGIAVVLLNSGFDIDIIFIGKNYQ